MELTRQRGAVAITLDRPRIVFFDLAATFLLVERYGFDFVAELYTMNGKQISLKSIDAFTFFLWAGLQSELAGTEETLTLEQVGTLIGPWNLRQVFNAVLIALTTALSVPALPGKVEAARPAAKRPAKKTPKRVKGSASTLMTRSGSRSRR